jgi:hypothetical protein
MVEPPGVATQGNRVTEGTSCPFCAAAVNVKTLRGGKTAHRGKEKIAWRELY